MAKNEQTTYRGSVITTRSLEEDPIDRRYRRFRASFSIRDDQSGLVGQETFVPEVFDAHEHAVGHALNRAKREVDLRLTLATCR
jgi:hypothetical protein